MISRRYISPSSVINITLANVWGLVPTLPGVPHLYSLWQGYRQCTQRPSAILLDCLLKHCWCQGPKWESVELVKAFVSVDCHMLVWSWFEFEQKYDMHMLSPVSRIFDQIFNSGYWILVNLQHWVDNNFMITADMDSTIRCCLSSGGAPTLLTPPLTRGQWALHSQSL